MGDTQVETRDAPVSARAASAAVDVDSVAPRRLTNIPALDGFRGMAILVVVLYHSAPLMPSVGKYGKGGALGVDAFFVLSGFLITALLLREQGQGGRIRVGAFYRRRALRLLPALIVLLAAQIVYASVTHQGIVQERESVLSVLFYYSNTWLHRGFLNPGLQGLWSLAVEEQFYLVWPLVLILFLGLRRRLSTVVVSMIAAVIAVSVYRAVRFNQGVPETYIYTRMITRADSLLMGALLAQLWVRRKLPSRRLTILAWPALAFFLYGVEHGYPASFLERGGYTIVALAVALMLLAVLESSWKVNAFLRLRALRAVGRISYALYIWHLLIFPAVEHYGGHWRPVVRLGVALALAAFAVTASWMFVEQPFLSWKAKLESGERTRVVPIQAIAIVVVAAVIGTTTLWVNSVTARPAKKLQTFASTSQLFTVPDIRGTNAFAAVLVLQGVHLNFKLTAQVERTGVAGLVISQTPAAGTRVRGGTIVQMTVRTKKSATG